MLSGCSFTDPRWQPMIPWSVQYSQQHPSYIVAQCGMSIYGICTEALYHLKTLTDIDKLILILPDLWRMDIEVDEETYLCNAIVDRLWAENGNYKIEIPGKRKWITSGGLHFDRKNERGRIFEVLYKHKGFLVLLKEQIRALKALIDYCKFNNISYYISAIQDPMDQLQGLDYIRDQIENLLQEAEYDNWFKFDDKFIDKFLGHSNHPKTHEHKILCDHILKLTN